MRVSLNTCINTSKKSRKLDTVPLNVNINPYEDIDEDALQIRQQFAVLKDRFDRQEIVTDRLLRQTQQRRMNIYDWINMYIPITVLVVMLPMLYLCHKSYGLPLWVAISAIIFALISVAVHYRERRRYSKTFNFEGDVLQIAECVRDFRKRQCKITAVGAVVSILFLVVGYSAWLPNVQLTDDPLRWALVILLLLAVFAITIAVEVKSMRLLENIVNDLEQ